MKYKVGEKVKLKKFQPEYEDFGFGTTSTMEKFFGTTVTIHRTHSDHFSIYEDNMDWSWEYDWIEDVQPVMLPEELFTL